MLALKQLLLPLLVVTCAVAVATDVRSRRIPDYLTYPAMLAALGGRLWLEGVGDLSMGLGSGVAGLGLAVGWFGSFALFGKGSMGWGDVKLAAVMGACLGLPVVPAALVFVSLAGALQAVVSLLWRGDLSATVRAVLSRKPVGERETGGKAHIPYGVAISLGSLWAMWWDGNASV